MRTSSTSSGVTPKDLAKKLRVMQIIVFLTTTATGILGLLGANVWMPLAVAVYSSLNTVLEYSMVGAQLRQTNGTLTVLKNQQIWWESLSMVERRMEENKQVLVTVTEHAICTEDVTHMSSSKGAQKKAGSKPGGEKGDEKQGEGGEDAEQ